MSIRRLLLLYVLAHDADGRSSAGGSEVAGRPEHAFPVALADVGALLAQQAKRLQAFKFELRPNGAQRQQMRCFAGSCRFVYNKGLALQKTRFEAGEKKLSYAGLCKLLTQWRSNAENSWLKDAPTHPLQQALKDLERAYTHFFAKRAAL